MIKIDQLLKLCLFNFVIIYLTYHPLTRSEATNYCLLIKDKLINSHLHRVKKEARKCNISRSKVANMSDLCMHPAVWWFQHVPAPLFRGIWWAFLRGCNKRTIALRAGCMPSGSAAWIMCHSACLRKELRAIWNNRNPRCDSVELLSKLVTAYFVKCYIEWQTVKTSWK